MLEDILKELLYAVVMACVIILTNWIRSLAVYKKIKSELETKRELALIAVQFVEQAFKDLKGQEKFNKAAEWLAEQLTKQGLKIDEKEIKALIEAAVRQMKDTFGEDWANFSKEDTQKLNG